MEDGGDKAEELNRFLRSHRILQVERAVFPAGWGFCVEWMDGGTVNSSLRSTSRVDYREVLAPDVFARFAALRTRRKKIAEQDGIAAYMIMTDAQLAEIAKHESPTLADLKKINGFGEARSAKYGERLLSEQFGAASVSLKSQGAKEASSASGNEGNDDGVVP